MEYNVCKIVEKSRFPWFLFLCFKTMSYLGWVDAEDGLQLTSYHSGLLAEAFCRLSLRLKGYSIVGTRRREKGGEIDILASKKRVLAVVEVKFRSDYAEAAGAITHRQRQRLERAAASFLRYNPKFSGYAVRFDAMLASPWHWPVHIVDAWREGLD